LLLFITYFEQVCEACWAKEYGEASEEERVAQLAARHEGQNDGEIELALAAAAEATIEAKEAKLALAVAEDTIKAKETELAAALAAQKVRGVH
jgi:hypothetical protein